MKEGLPKNYWKNAKGKLENTVATLIQVIGRLRRRNARRAGSGCQAARRLRRRFGAGGERRGGGVPEPARARAAPRISVASADGTAISFSPRSRRATHTEF